MYKVLQLKATGVRSLSWCGDKLIDWVAGGRLFALDGSIRQPSVNYAYSFDAAVTSPSSTYVVLYAKNQTKGLVLKHGEVFREINRSYYQAHLYDFPIAFSISDEGKEVLLHCPNDYCQLDVEDVESGEIFSALPTRKPSDVFHSRLVVSPSGRWLISAGWVWHPLDVVELYDLEGSFTDLSKLDNPSLVPPGLWEISTAAFLSDSLVYVGSSAEFLGDEDNQDDNQPGSHRIALWSLETNTYNSSIACNHPIGELMPLTEKYVVSFYEHPRLWDMETGELIKEWSGIHSGTQKSSISRDDERVAIAVDIKNKRVAIADECTISIVEFSPYCR